MSPESNACVNVQNTHLPVTRLTGKSDQNRLCKAENKLGRMEGTQWGLGAPAGEGGGGGTGQHCQAIKR